MGSTRWSDDHYRERARIRAATGKSAFEYDAAIRDQAEEERKVNDRMNPLRVNFRESRDSGNHPTSRAVSVLFDVTGSMRNVPRILQANLPRLMNLLIDREYLEHPQIMVGGIGDATCDRAPLQIGQFESGIEIDEDLGRLYLEGGGGGHITESYELAMYFMAHHTAIDCHERRGQPGYLFLIGDEIPYYLVKREEVEQVIGDRLQADIPTEEVLAELQRRYDVYFILPKMTHHWNSKEVRGRWTELLGQNVLRLEDPAGICELIASTIGIAEGRLDLTALEGDLEQAGASSTIARAVTHALDTVGAGSSTARNTPTPGTGWKHKDSE
jgi:hypothetical protein